MAWQRAPYRPDSPKLTICHILESDGPLSQLDIAARMHVRRAWVCKCLKRLTEDGYVEKHRERVWRSSNFVHRTYIYRRTAKPLPAPGLPDATEMPNYEDLAAVMADMVRLSLV